MRMIAELKRIPTGLKLQNLRTEIALIICLTAALVVQIGSTAEVRAENNSVQIGSDPAAAQRSPFVPEVDMIFIGGYRHDDLDWSIAGDSSGNNPNILSELSWEDVESFQVKFHGTLIWPKILALRGVADYGWIYNGDVQDSDYLFDNRTFEFSRSNNNADDGDVWDVSGAIGYPFRTGRDIIGTIIPLVGYSYHEQNLKMTDGYQTIPPLGSFPGLDSSYDTKWKGPWIGIDLNFKAAEPKSFAHRFETFFSYEYHWTDYEAKGNWNLRDDFEHPKSFKHDADGSGWIIRTGFNFVLHQNVALNFTYDYQDWTTNDGTDKTYFADGTTAKTQLNEVNWTAYSLGLGLSVRF